MGQQMMKKSLTISVLVDLFLDYLAENLFSRVRLGGRVGVDVVRFADYDLVLRVAGFLFVDVVVRSPPQPWLVVFVIQLVPALTKSGKGFLWRTLAASSL